MALKEQEIIFEEEESIDILAIFLRMVKYWYFIGASVFIALIIGYIYTKYTVSAYQLNTTLLVKENPAGSTTGKVLKEMDFFSEKSNIQNEIVLLKSYANIYQTLKELDFSISYFVDNGYAKNDLYLSAPFKVIIDSSQLQATGVYFKIEVIDNKQYKLSAKGEKAGLYSFIDNAERGKLGYIDIVEQVYQFGQKVDLPGTNFTILLNDKIDEYNIQKIGFGFHFNNINAQTLAFKKTLEISEVDKDVDVILIKLTGNNIQKTADFLNKLTEVYIRKGLEKKNSIATNTINFIDNQLADITDSLTFAENKLQNYRSSHKIMDLDFQTQQLFERLTSLQKEKAVLVANKEYYTYLTESIYKSDAVGELMVPSTLGVQDISLNKLVMELVDLNTQKLALQNNASEKSLALINIENKIENSKKLILKNINNISEANDIANRNIEKKINQLEAEVRQLPVKQQKLFGFEREFKLNDAIYTFLLEKRAEAQIAKASNQADSEVIDVARVNVFEEKSSKKKLILIIAFLIGLIIPMGLIYLDYAIKGQIQLPKDIEKITDATIIGSITKTKKNCIHVFNEHPTCTTASSFRTLYNNLQFFTKGNDKQVFMISSSIPQEGKTFNAINLAAVFAKLGKKTCLLSFDLRLPKIHEEFDIDNSIGLSTYLGNYSTLKEIIYKTSVENLFVLPAGPIPPNPVELIASENTEKLFSYLKENFDSIIIDTPPVGVVADAILLEQFSDINILVARQSFTKKKVLEKCLKDLKQNNFKNLSIIFNGVKQAAVYNYGYQNYYYNNNGQKGFVKKLLAKIKGKA